MCNFAPKILLKTNNNENVFKMLDHYGHCCTDDV